MTTSPRAQETIKHADYENKFAIEQQMWKVGYFQRAGSRGITVEGLVHQPLCGLPTDGHSVRTGPWVNIICILNNSQSRSRSAFPHLLYFTITLSLCVWSVPDLQKKGCIVFQWFVQLLCLPVMYLSLSFNIGFQWYHQTGYFVL